MSHTLAIDLGGTKIASAYFDTSMQMSDYQTRPLEQYTLAYIRAQLQRITEHYWRDDIARIGISMNGLISSNRIVFSRLCGGDVDRHISELISLPRSVPIIIDNDVHCMCRGVQQDMPELAASSYALINIGTGLRVSVWSGEGILSGADGFAGEVRDDVDVLELGETVNLNNLICGRGISNIYAKLT